MLLSGPGAKEIADDGETGRYADACGQLLAAQRTLADRLDDGEGGAHGTLGIELIRLWPSEIDEDAIAEVLCDKAAEPLTVVAMVR